MKSFSYTVKDELGIHARPAGMLVKEVKNFKSKVTLEKDGKVIDATRLMAVMSMGVKKDQTVTITVEGADEDAAYIVFYVVFRFAITKFDLKTPGREDDDVEAEKNVDLGSSDYTTVAAAILEGVGGAANIKSIDNCITRLRLEVKDSSLVDEKKIKSAGAAGVIRPSKTAVQVVIGTKVQFVADEFKKLCR